MTRSMVEQPEASSEAFCLRFKDVDGSVNLVNQVVTVEMSVSVLSCLKENASFSAMSVLVSLFGKTHSYAGTVSYQDLGHLRLNRVPFSHLRADHLKSVVERHDRRPVFRFFLLEDLRARRHSLVASSTAHAAMKRSVVT